MSGPATLEFQQGSTIVTKQPGATSWVKKVAIIPSDPATLTRVLGTPSSSPYIWWMLSPGGELAPMEVSVPPLAGMALCDEVTGVPTQANRIGVGSHWNRALEFPSPLLPGRFLNIVHEANCLQEHRRTTLRQGKMISFEARTRSPPAASAAPTIQVGRGKVGRG